MKYFLGYIFSTFISMFYILCVFPPGGDRPIPLSIILGIIAMIPAIIANNKGRSFWGWLIYGNFLWIIALIHSIVLTDNDNAMKKNSDLKKCPFCGEFIRQEAVKCRYCQSELPVDTIK
ncbi:zinc ribbon domain-containing protein [Veillonella sp. T34266-5]|uniref:zinc ribbon domain-containing protein n=1 Tax=Veillonella sp. T34266-5 TaxID=2027457 RepID=UPI0011B0750C|nr:zinc ribbon domain-containing protein [Veillonella sp. T34266-5]